VVFSFDRFRLSADWFEIDMSDAITPGGLGGVSAQNLIDACYVGSFGGFNTSPRCQATAWLTYGRDRFTTTLETRYIGAGSLNATRFTSPPGDPTNTQLFSMTTNQVDDRYYLSWSGSYNFQRASSDNQMQVFWVVNNLLDQDPPVAPGGNFTGARCRARCCAGAWRRPARLDATRPSADRARRTARFVRRCRRWPESRARLPRAGRLPGGAVSA
jgi:hypothetical protein